MLLYEALASHLFEEDMDPLTPYGLMRAAEMPFVSAGRAPELIDLYEEGTGATVTESEEFKEPGGRGHGLTEEDFRPAIPKPTPFSREPIPRPKAGATTRPVSGRSRSPASTSGLRGTVQELEQVRQLKEEHYGWHCQACLGLYDVQNITPAHTYLALPKYRRQMVEAHHVDHLQNEGALGAANLIALCKYHHDLLGDKLTGAIVRSGLGGATPLTRRFPGAGSADATELVGLVVSVSLDTEPYQVKLFFTRDHANAWTNSKDGRQDP